MKFKSRTLVLLGACGVLILGLAGCSRKEPGQTASTRPSCVSLSSYSSVIDQVMNVIPGWVPLAQIKDGYQYRWTSQDDVGNYTLTSTLTSDGCVCATAATTAFHGGQNQGEQAGLFLGAAVAPVSELDYMGNWLEPKILLQCSFAFLFNRTYEADTLMEDGTSWKLTCSKNQGAELDERLTSLTVIAPRCVDLLK